MNTTGKTLAMLAIAGLVTGATASVVIAEEAGELVKGASQVAADAADTHDKDGCDGKDGCDAKDGCDGKDKDSCEGKEDACSGKDGCSGK